MPSTKATATSPDSEHWHAEGDCRDHAESRSLNSECGLTFYRSRRRNFLLALLVVAGASLAIPFATADEAWVQVAAAAWLGLCAHAAYGLIERADERRPMVRIDARGIFDARVLPRPIEWWEIAFVYPLDLRCSRVVELHLRDPHRTLADAPWHIRSTIDWPLPHVCISLLLLDGTVAQAVEAIRRHAPHLVPKAMFRTQDPVRLRLKR